MVLARCLRVAPLLVETGDLIGQRLVWSGILVINSNTVQGHANSSLGCSCVGRSYDGFQSETVVSVVTGVMLVSSALFEQQNTHEAGKQVQNGFSVFEGYTGIVEMGGFGDAISLPNRAVCQHLPNHHQQVLYTVFYRIMR